MSERPMLTCRGGQWMSYIYYSENPELVRPILNDMQDVRIIPRDRFSEWLHEHDPDHIMDSFAPMARITFSSENAAMMFRLMTDAEVERLD